MDTDHSCLATMVLDTQAFPHQVEAIKRFVREHFSILVCRADRLRHRYGIADPAFDADDAVQAVMLKVIRAVKNGTVDELENDGRLMKLFLQELNHCILTERDREHTRKRGGAGADPDGRRPAIHRADLDLETIHAAESAPEAQASAADEAEWLLALLDRRDPSLRAVATMKLDGFTHQEIAARLGRPLSAVEKRVRRIKAILRHRYPEHS